MDYSVKVEEGEVVGKQETSVKYKKKDGEKKKSINEKPLSEEEPCTGIAIAGPEKKKEKKKRVNDDYWKEPFFQRLHNRITWIYHA